MASCEDGSFYWWLVSTLCFHWFCPVKKSESSPYCSWIKWSQLMHSVLTEIVQLPISALHHFWCFLSFKNHAKLKESLSKAMKSIDMLGIEVAHGLQDVAASKQKNAHTELEKLNKKKREITEKLEHVAKKKRKIWISKGNWKFGTDYRIPELISFVFLFQRFLFKTHCLT